MPNSVRSISINLLIYQLCADEDDVVDEQPVDNKRFMMSVITASPPQEDTGEKMVLSSLRTSFVVVCFILAVFDR